MVNPIREVPDVLIATTASLDDKLWPQEKWCDTLGAVIAAGHSVGLLGAPPKDQGKYWKGADEESRLIEIGIEDLRGQFTLPEVVGALDAARAILTIDNGILHMACATDTPVVGLYRNGIHRLWAPPKSNLQVVEPGEGGAVAEVDSGSIQEKILKILK